MKKVGWSLLLGLFAICGSCFCLGVAVNIGQEMGILPTTTPRPTESPPDTPLPTATETNTPTPSLTPLPTDTLLPTKTATSTPTGTATLTPTLTLVPTLTSTPTLKATIPPTRPPAPSPTLPPTSAEVCDCSGDVYKCDDFKNTPFTGQACFNYCMEQGRGDIHRLDGDGDGLVCEN